MDSYSDDDFVTIETACKIVGGSESPIHKATFYRNVILGLLPPPEHPTPGVSRVNVGKLRAAKARNEANWTPGPRKTSDHDEKIPAKAG